MAVNIEEIMKKPDMLLGREISNEQWEKMVNDINGKIHIFNRFESDKPYNRNVNVYRCTESGDYSEKSYNIYSDMPEEVLNDNNLRKYVVAKRVLECIKNGDAVMIDTPYGEPALIDLNDGNIIRTSLNEGEEYKLKEVNVPNIKLPDEQPPKEVSQPEEVKRPGAFTRFLNAVTFGAYAKAECTRYNRYKEKLEAYNDYCKKNNEYLNKYPEYANQVKKIEKYKTETEEYNRISRKIEEMKPIIQNEAAWKERFVQRFSDELPSKGKSKIGVFDDENIKGIDERFDKALGSVPFEIEGGVLETFKSDKAYNVPEGLEDVWSAIVLCTGHSMEGMKGLKAGYTKYPYSGIEFFMDGNIISDVIGKENYGCRDKVFYEHLDITKKAAESLAKEISENKFDRAGEMLNNAFVNLNSQMISATGYMDDLSGRAAFIRCLKECIKMSEKYPEIGKMVDSRYIDEAKSSIKLFDAIKQGKMQQKKLAGELTEPDSAERRKILIDSLAADYIQKKLFIHYDLNIFGNQQKASEIVMKKPDLDLNEVGSLVSEQLTILNLDSKCSDFQMNFGKNPDGMMQGIHKIIEQSDTFKKLMKMDPLTLKTGMCSELAIYGRIDGPVNDIIREEREMVKDVVNDRKIQNEVQLKNEKVEQKHHEIVNNL